MELSYNCRRVKSQDLELFSELITKAQTETDASVIRSCLLELIPFGAYCATCYFDNTLAGLAIGCAYDGLFAEDYKPPAGAFYLSDLAAHPQYRNSGIATESVKLLARHAAATYQLMLCHTFYNSKAHHLLINSGWKINRTCNGRIELITEI